MKILTVDDDPTNQKLLGAVLEAENHTIFQAANGYEALQVLERENVGLIISDILMPRMDGYRFCYEVRSRPSLATLPLIIYTSTYTSPADAELARKTGADKFLRKPASAQDILAAIAEVMAKRHAPIEAFQPPDELALMKEYSERLIAKLEEKNIDLADQNEALLQAKKQMALQSAALETAANAIIITDHRGLIQWVNPAFTTLTGYSAEEVRGKTPRLLKSGQHDEAFYRNFWEVIASGKTWRGEFVNRRKDGSIYYDEHTVTPVRSEGGAITHFVGVIHDITERKKLEQEVVFREQRLNAFFTGATAGLALFDGDLRFIQINDTLAAMNGVAASAHIGRTVDEIVPQLAPTLVPMLRQVLTTGRPILNAELTGETPGQPKIQRHWTESFFPIAGEDGTPEAVGAIVVEITERKRVEADLIRFNRAAVGRELRMVELKEQVNELAGAMGKAKPYALTFLPKPAVLNGDPGSCGSERGADEAFLPSKPQS